jgi:hypothetical protein
LTVTEQHSKYTLSIAVFSATLCRMANVTVNLRIIDAIRNRDSPVFEGLVARVTAGDVVTRRGRTSRCDGTNNNENPFGGPARTNALHRQYPRQWDE